MTHFILENSENTLSLPQQNDKEGLKLVHRANTIPGVVMLSIFGSMGPAHIFEDSAAKAAGDNKGKVTREGAESPAGCNICPCVTRKGN